MRQSKRGPPWPPFGSKQLSGAFTSAVPTFFPKFTPYVTSSLMTSSPANSDLPFTNYEPPSATQPSVPYRKKKRTAASNSSSSIPSIPLPIPILTGLPNRGPNKPNKPRKEEEAAEEEQ
ncbi:hypothetical protein PG994_012239 [Apiospora phragmitis]|uniref:Uncharacterized protein n=1 Tax=Apiospora phragmitis TaxID=2905665 RepID=A0ABR1TXV4_9PEZI